MMRHYCSYFYFLFVLFFIRDKVIAETLTPSSLYSPQDYVVTLTPENFDQHVYNSSSAWIVQFYNSWCGHCIRFSPTWKQLAANIDNWRKVIQLGVINCASPDNTAKCGAYAIKTFPTMRLFSPNTVNFTIPGEFRPTNRDNLTKLHEDLLLALESLNLTSSSPPPQHWPHLQPVQKDSLKSDPQLVAKNETILVVEDESSFIGRNLIMDLNDQKALSVRRILKQDYEQLSNPYRIYKVSKDDRSTPIDVVNTTTREGVYEEVRRYLNSNGYSVPALVLKNVTGDDYSSVKQTAAQQKMVHMVFRQDVEAALNFTLVTDVVQKDNITGPALAALIQFLQVVDKYFPFETPNEAFAMNVSIELAKYSSLRGVEFKALLEKHATDFLKKPKQWVGCKGSIENRRGYTCGLWMTFHMLTVRRYVASNGSVSSEPEVLDAIKEYVRNFFGCTECGQHFLEMSQTIKGNVSGGSDELMWLWRAHNTVNKRLAGDYTEDPAFPKVIFPHSKVCTNCVFINGTWNEANVLKYLIKMYTDLRPASDASALRLMYANISNSFGLAFTRAHLGMALFVIASCLMGIVVVRSFLIGAKPKVQGMIYKA